MEISRAGHESKYLWDISADSPYVSEYRGETVVVEAQEYEFNDILPVVEFTVEVLDDKYEPVRQVDFLVSVDGGPEQAARSDDTGTVKVNSTASAVEMKISFG
jgi:hypothetical protein